MCFAFFVVIHSQHVDNENEKQFSKQASSHGSLSSITTTSIASSDDPKGGRDSGNFDEKGGGFDRKPSKNIQPPIKQEEWWKTTLQVSIPFLIAGLGTIGAGLILGRVEVSNLNFFIILRGEYSFFLPLSRKFAVEI